MSWTNSPKVSSEEMICLRGKLVFYTIENLLKTALPSDLPTSTQDLLLTWIPKWIIDMDREAVQKYRDTIGFKEFKHEFYKILISSGTFGINNSGVPYRISRVTSTTK